MTQGHKDNTRDYLTSCHTPGLVNVKIGIKIHEKNLKQLKIPIFAKQCHMFHFKLVIALRGLQTKGWKVRQFQYPGRQGAIVQGGAKFLSNSK